MSDEDSDARIMEELSNGTPWNAIAEKYQISTQTISEKLSHRHCPVCATPIFMFEQFCGPGCEKAFKRVQRRRQKMVFVPLLLIIPYFLLILLLGHR